MGNRATTYETMGPPELAEIVQGAIHAGLNCELGESRHFAVGVYRAMNQIL
jgi:hypothetical protein